MYGYVQPLRGELKVKELAVYQSYYCSLCLALKKKYPIWGRLSLNYDMTFLGLLLTSLYEPKQEEVFYRCLFHPFHKKRCFINPYISYAADMNILLTYYKCMDDWVDERRTGRFIYAKLLHFSVKKVRKKYPKKAEGIEKQLQALRLLEQENSRDLDRTAGCFGKVCAVLFSCAGEWEDSLETIGFYLGKFIYLLDAYVDLEQDEKKGCYNPFLFYRERENFTEWVQGLLQMTIAAACRAFEKLPLLLDVEIMRNILYGGVWASFRQGGKAASCGHNREAEG